MFITLEKLYESILSKKMVPKSETNKNIVKFKPLEDVYTEDVQVMYARPGSEVIGPIAIDNQIFDTKIEPVLYGKYKDDDEYTIEDILVRDRIKIIANTLNIQNKQFIDDVYDLFFNLKNKKRVQFNIDISLKNWVNLNNCFHTAITSEHKKIIEQYGVNIFDVVENIVKYDKDIGFIQFKIIAGENRALNYGTGEFLLSRCIKNAVKSGSHGDIDLNGSLVEVKGVTPETSIFQIVKSDIPSGYNYNLPPVNILNTIVKGLKYYITSKNIESFIFINKNSEILYLPLPDNFTNINNIDVFEYFKQYNIIPKLRKDRSTVGIHFKYRK